MINKASCHNRLTILGPARTVARMAGNDNWEKALMARYVTWLELSSTRHVCEFTTAGRPLEQLERLSRRWPTLLFLLDYECGRSKGLVKARKGELESCEIHY